MDVQERLDRAISEIGGYWIALAGLARVLEELGELAEASKLEGRRQEASDCTVATLALANQYCVRVPVADPPETNAGEREALIAAGHLARLVNRFEGSKPPKPLEPGVPRLPEVFSVLIAGLAASAELSFVQIMERAAATVESNALRDIGRFAPRVDAISAPSRATYAREILKVETPHPAIGLWGLSNASESSAEIERFLRVDAAHPLLSLVAGPFDPVDPTAASTSTRFADLGGAERVRAVCGASGLFVTLAGSRQSETTA